MSEDLAALKIIENIAEHLGKIIAEQQKKIAELEAAQRLAPVMPSESEVTEYLDSLICDRHDFEKGMNLYRWITQEIKRRSGE